MSALTGQNGLSRLAMFSITESNDPTEIDSRSQVSDRFPGQSRDYRYVLQDGTILRMHFERPILSVAIRSAGPLLASYGESRFATEVTMLAGESDVFGFSSPLQGEMTLIQRGEASTVTSLGGLVYRLGPVARLVTSDDSVRTNVFIKAADLTQTLEHMLDRRLRVPLKFEPVLDWSRGLAASLKLQLDFVLKEFERADGIASNQAALVAMVDLLSALILRGVRHNYSDQLEPGLRSTVPAYVYRAEEFMRVHCATPIRIADVAAAAGCSVRTLNAVFQQFRGQVPLAALQAFRLEQVHAELSRGAREIAIGTVARCYGFTNASRFNVAFERRFGETPRAFVGRAFRLRGSAR